MTRTYGIQGLGPADAIQARCGACRKVIIVGRARGDLLPSVVIHLEEEHPHLQADLMVVLEGEHFILEKAPPARCDLCGAPAERPWWVWVTPVTNDFKVEDPEWCVCDGCNPYVESHDVIGLCRRAWEVADQEFVITNPDARKEGIRNIITRFLSHTDPQLTYRETV